MPFETFKGFTPSGGGASSFQGGGVTVGSPAWLGGGAGETQLTPQDMNALWNVQQQENERSRASGMNVPGGGAAAANFPAVDPFMQLLQQYLTDPSGFLASSQGGGGGGITPSQFDPNLPPPADIAPQDTTAPNLPGSTQAESAPDSGPQVILNQFQPPSTPGDNITPGMMGPQFWGEPAPADTTAPAPADTQPASYYPSGDGSTYVALDANGNPIGTTPAPKLSDRPGGASPDLPFGGFGQPSGFFDPGTAGPGPLPQTFGGSEPFGQTGSQPVFSGGAFLSPPGGSIGGPLGTGSWGDIPFFGRQNLQQGMKFGFTPNVVGAGFPVNNPVSQYGALSRFTPPSYSTIGQYYSANKGFVGDPSAARGTGGPNARATAAT